MKFGDVFFYIHLVIMYRLYGVDEKNVKKIK